MFSRVFGHRRTGGREARWLEVLALAVLMAQCACVTTSPVMAPGSTPGHYGYSNAPVGLDSPSATCRNSLSACAALYGKEIASTTAVLKAVLDEAAKKSIEEELSKCANLARAEVILRYSRQFKGPAPDGDECRQETKSKGRRVTWAMRLGIEMHEVARKCAEEALNTLRPGRFSLEQRYRIIDLETGEKELVSAEEEEALVNSGNTGELTGTLKPDVVIHEGDPLKAQAAYDFKFPCGENGKPPDWGRYPKGHPLAKYTQKTAYEQYIAPFVARILPWLGVLE